MRTANLSNDSEATFVRREKAAEYLRAKYGFCSLKTLAKLASIGGGPKMSYAGRLPLYKLEDLDTWALAQISRPVRSTSEADTVRKAAIYRQAEAR
ncbi:MAG TPA: hypothetical protein VEK34_11210 [Methylocella sp.]|nr:hypothetical protein [Methylocella sp.]